MRRRGGRAAVLVVARRYEADLPDRAEALPTDHQPSLIAPCPSSARSGPCPRPPKRATPSTVRTAGRVLHGRYRAASGVCRQACSAADAATRGASGERSLARCQGGRDLPDAATPPKKHRRPLDLAAGSARSRRPPTRSETDRDNVCRGPGGSTRGERIFPSSAPLRRSGRVATFRSLEVPRESGARVSPGWWRRAGAPFSTHWPQRESSAPCQPRFTAFPGGCTRTQSDGIRPSRDRRPAGSGKPVPTASEWHHHPA